MKKGCETNRQQLTLHIIIKMKHIFNLFIIAIVFSACNNNASLADQNNTATPDNLIGDPNAPMPEMTYEKEEITLTPIEEGEEVTILYNYTNTGKSDLIISGTKGSCGCTSTEHSPKRPLKPGEKGYIRAIFNSSGKPKNNTKTITVTSNDPGGAKVLKFNVYVNPQYND